MPAELLKKNFFQEVEILEAINSWLVGDWMGSASYPRELVKYLKRFNREQFHYKDGYLYRNVYINKSDIKKVKDAKRVFLQTGKKPLQSWSESVGAIRNLTHDDSKMDLIVGANIKSDNILIRLWDFRGYLDQKERVVTTELNKVDKQLNQLYKRVNRGERISSSKIEKLEKLLDSLHYYRDIIGVTDNHIREYKQEKEWLVWLPSMKIRCDVILKREDEDIRWKRVSDDQPDEVIIVIDNPDTGEAHVEVPNAQSNVQPLIPKKDEPQEELQHAASVRTNKRVAEKWAEIHRMVNKLPFSTLVTEVDFKSDFWIPINRLRQLVISLEDEVRRLTWSIEVTEADRISARTATISSYCREIWNRIRKVKKEILASQESQEIKDTFLLISADMYTIYTEIEEATSMTKKNFKLSSLMPPKLDKGVYENDQRWIKLKEIGLKVQDLREILLYLVGDDEIGPIRDTVNRLYNFADHMSYSITSTRRGLRDYLLSTDEGEHKMALLGLYEESLRLAKRDSKEMWDLIRSKKNELSAQIERIGEQKGSFIIPTAYEVWTELSDMEDEVESSKTGASETTGGHLNEEEREVIDDHMLFLEGMSWENLGKEVNDLLYHINEQLEDLIAAMVSKTLSNQRNSDPLPPPNREDLIKNIKKLRDLVPEHRDKLTDMIVDIQFMYNPSKTGAVEDIAEDELRASVDTKRFLKDPNYIDQFFSGSYIPDDFMEWDHDNPVFINEMDNLFLFLKKHDIKDYERVFYSEDRRENIIPEGFRLNTLIDYDKVATRLVDEYSISSNAGTYYFKLYTVNDLKVLSIETSGHTSMLFVKKGQNIKNIEASMKKDKKAYVSPTHGELTLTVQVNERPELSITVDFGVPNFTIFSITVPIDPGFPDSVETIATMCFQALLDDMLAFFMSMKYDTELSKSLYGLVVNAYEHLKTTDDTSAMFNTTDKDIRTYEVEFPLPQDFVNETLDKVITASSKSGVKRSPAPPPKLHQIKVINKKDNSIAEAARIVKQYRTRSLKSQPQPLFVVVYNNQGRPVGVQRLK